MGTFLLVRQHLPFNGGQIACVRVGELTLGHLLEHLDFQPTKLIFMIEPIQIDFLSLVTFSV